MLQKHYQQLIQVMYSTMTVVRFYIKLEINQKQRKIHYYRIRAQRSIAIT